MIKTIYIPRINANDNNVAVVEWHITDGAYVDLDQEIVDLETSKAVVTLSAEDSGYVKILSKKGSIAKVGDELFLLSESLEELEKSNNKNIEVSEEKQVAIREVIEQSSEVVIGSFETTRFSKASLEYLKHNEIPIERFQGLGLITLDYFSPASKPVVLKPDDASQLLSGKVEETSLQREEKVTLSKIAEIDALSVGESGNINSTLSVLFNSENIRKRLKHERFCDGNLQPLILYEISRLLKNWPILTAFYYDKKIKFYDRVDLGLAIDMGKGLKVVTLKDADKMMPMEFHEKILDFGIRYNENRLKSLELTGSTFTITDLSFQNILYFHPLINGLQSAILGIGGDSSQPCHPMTLTITYDHRVTNGREVAGFLNSLKDRLLSYSLPEEENPGPIEYKRSEQGLSGSLKPISCDVCGIQLDRYYKEFSTDACMVAYFRTDESIGSICHRCRGGF